MTEGSLQKSLALRGLFGFLLQVVLRLRGLLLIPILVRALPPAEVGVLNLANAFSGWVGPLLLLGMNTGFALRVVHLTGRAVKPAIVTVLAFTVVFSVAGFLLILLIVNQGIFGAVVTPLRSVMLPIGLLAIGTTIREVATVFPQVRQHLTFIGQNSIVTYFGGVLLAIALVLMGFGAYGALVGPALMCVIGAALAVTYSLRIAEGPFAFDVEFLRSTLRSALPVVPLALALWTLQSSDYFFISYFHGTESVAIYALAYNFASPALMAMAAMNLTYLPTCVEILARGRDDFARFIDNSTRLFALGGIAGVTLSVVAGPAITSLIAGPVYLESGRLFPVVVGAYVLFSLSQLQQFVPGAMTQNLSGAARAHGWGAALNVVANLAVVPRFGYWGAAWATCVSYGLVLFLLTREVKALLPEISWPRQILRVGVVTAISVTVGFLFQPYAKEWPTLMGLSLLSLAVVLAIGWGFGLITRQDLAYLKLDRATTTT